MTGGQYDTHSISWNSHHWFLSNMFCSFRSFFKFSPSCLIPETTKLIHERCFEAIKSKCDTHILLHETCFIDVCWICFVVFGLFSTFSTPAWQPVWFLKPPSWLISSVLRLRKDSTIHILWHETRLIDVHWICSVVFGLSFWLFHLLPVWFLKTQTPTD